LKRNKGKIPPKMRLFTSSTAGWWIVSLALHGAIIGGSGLLLTQRPEFGMKVSKNSVAVDLVASPIVHPPEPESVPEALPIIPTPAQDDLIMPKPKRESPHSIATLKPVLPDPSGQDLNTRRQASGAEVRASPDYLSNPSPIYPEMLRSKNIEGRVLLLVHVSAEGRVNEVRVAKSSGQTAFDRAATQAVQRWRFSPSRVGSIPIASEVEVPIIFKIK
jgi:periplasmic protein TonB